MLKISRLWTDAKIPTPQPRPKTKTGYFREDGSYVPFGEPKSVYGGLNERSKHGA